MTNKEAAWHLGTYSTTMGSGQTTDDQHNEAKRIAIRALKQEPCDDCISRQYLLSIANEDEAYGYVSSYDIANAPSAKQQESKTGYWIEDENEMKVRCSECGEDNDECSKYCPNCGAKMSEIPTGSESEK